MIGADVHWRIWANMIARRPACDHERLIQEFPDPEILAHFQTTSDNAQRRVSELRQSVTLALETIDGMLEDWDLLNNEMAMLASKMANYGSLLRTKKRVIEGFQRDLVIRPVDTSEQLRNMPNLEDVEHDA